MVNSKTITNLELSNDPKICTRSILFQDSNEEVKNKNRKQFITSVPATLTVVFDDNTKLNLFADKNTIFDGASIPFNIGKGDMRLLIPALFHDLMCENKYLVNYDRKLSSNIFKQALLKCSINRIIAEIMYTSVEIYQKLFCDWREQNG